MRLGVALALHRLYESLTFFPILLLLPVLSERKLLITYVHTLCSLTLQNCGSVQSSLSRKLEEVGGFDLLML